MRGRAHVHIHECILVGYTHSRLARCPSSVVNIKVRTQKNVWEKRNINPFFKYPNIRSPGSKTRTSIFRKGEASSSGYLDDTRWHHVTYLYEKWPPSSRRCLSAVNDYYNASGGVEVKFGRRLRNQGSVTHVRVSRSSTGYIHVYIMVTSHEAASRGFGMITSFVNWFLGWYAFASGLGLHFYKCVIKP